MLGSHHILVPRKMGEIVCVFKFTEFALKEIDFAFIIIYEKRHDISRSYKALELRSLIGGERNHIEIVFVDHLHGFDYFRVDIKIN